MTNTAGTVLLNRQNRIISINSSASDWLNLKEGDTFDFPGAGQLIKVITGSGEATWLYCQAEPIILEKKDYILCTLLPVRDGRAVYDNSIRNLNNLRRTIDQFAIVAVTDRSGRITHANDQFCRISKYSRAELIGQDHRIVNSGYHSKEFFRDLWKTISSGRTWRGEVKNRNKEGENYWVDTVIFPVMDENNRPEEYIAIRIDITDKKERQFALLEAKEAAEAASRAKNDFLANVSHEIRTPMNGVIGMLNLLKDTELDLEQYEFVNIAETSAEALLEIINEILDFSRIESGRIEFEYIEFELRSLLEDVINLLLPKSERKNIDLLLHVEPDVPEWMMTDPGRLRQILINLVDNAIKFTEDGYVLIHIAKSGRPAEDDLTDIKFSIKDTGEGIPREKLKKIFDRFEQADTSTTRKHGGTGIGLSIVQRLIQLMGGKIKVESRLNEGAKFTFNLPLKITENPRRDSRIDRSILKNVRVLVVDDNATNCRIIKYQLEHRGMRCDSEQNPREAIARMMAAHEENDPYEIAVLDFKMPVLDGYELGLQIKNSEELNDIHLVMLTSSAHRGDAKRYREAGFSGFLVKPALETNLSGVLALILKNREDTEQLVTVHTVKEIKKVSKPEISRKGTGRLKVLLVEDNKINQAIAQKMLEKFNCLVETADNGHEAVQMAEEVKYDYIFMDCLMPVLDGFDATRRIREGRLNATTRIIALTANAMEGDRDRCISAGMDDYIAKPLSPADLALVIEK